MLLKGEKEDVIGIAVEVKDRGNFEGQICLMDNSVINLLQQNSLLCVQLQRRRAGGITNGKKYFFHHQNNYMKVELKTQTNHDFVFPVHQKTGCFAFTLLYLFSLPYPSEFDKSNRQTNKMPFLITYRTDINYLLLNCKSQHHFMQSAMIFPNQPSRPFTSNISLRVQKLPFSHPFPIKIEPSVAHLSSLIQSAKKQQINRELLSFAKTRLSCDRLALDSSLPSRQKTPKSTVILFDSNKSKEVNTPINKRRISEGQIFLSELAQQESPIKNGHPSGQDKSLLQWKRRNYLMRKLEFNNFIAHQQNSKKPKEAPTQEPNQIEYQDQKVKKGSFKFNVRNYTSDSIRKTKVFPVANQRTEAMLRNLANDNCL